jgi:Mrp family chromosome partitioning ATPase
VQHELFGVAQRLGLGDLLEVGADEDGALGAEEARRSDTENLRLITEGALETAHPDLKNLHLMTAGMVRSHASRLLHSRGFAAALMQRFRQFDVVLIDTPAVLDDPDARIFGRIADSVALVLRASSTSLEDAVAARDRFLSDRTPLAGAVLNDCERTSDRAKRRASGRDAKHGPTVAAGEGTALPPYSSRARSEG